MATAESDLDTEVSRWFEGKEFTTDWVSRKINRWARYMARFRQRQVQVLEVGSYEGRSAVFLLNYLPQAKLTCIDLFPQPLNTRFDRNTAEFGPERLTKITGSAIAILDQLAGEKRRFHLIYLDAGKRRDHVLAMSLIAWPLLRANGVLIWDDYDWGPSKPPEERPHDAIDYFLSLHKDQLEILWQKGQVFVKKLEPATNDPATSLAAREAER